ncbi:MAG: hypothetical protein JXP73_18865 [Deltaproteobacteria bacterium]|nr:hypothetical protein [Deltaproteobacteria bacterium]
MAFPRRSLVALLACLPALRCSGALAGESFDRAAYEAALAALESKRIDLCRRLSRARSAAERAAIRQQARRTVLNAVTETIFPAWMATPWGLGPDSTALRPHQPGMVVGCSYFVTGVLLNAGLRLSSRARFAQAPSLLMQRALTPDARDLHRYPGLRLDVLTRRLLALGDGVYIVGLNIHTGFLVIKAGTVRVVHASYAPPQQVVDEALGESAVIALSRRRGYVVTPIFKDDRLVDYWLSGRRVPAPTWRPRRSVGRGSAAGQPQ